MRLALIKDGPLDDLNRQEVMLAWDTLEVARRIIQEQFDSEITTILDRTWLQTLLRKPKEQTSQELVLANVIEQAFLSLLRDSIRL